MEMLLSISFGVKDSMLDWQWLGIDPQGMAISTTRLGDVQIGTPSISLATWKNKWLDGSIILGMYCTQH